MTSNRFGTVNLLSLLPALVNLRTANSWAPPVKSFLTRRRSNDNAFRRRSTPFEVDLYDNPYDDNDKGLTRSSLSQPPDTKLVIGLNKYSHDASLCAANARTGEVLFAISKERLTRRKHDSGNVAGTVEACLEALDLDLESIESVVINNHHHRVEPLERNVRHMEWECGLHINGGMEDGYDDPENLLSLPSDGGDKDAIRKHELSHHLAHAYSAATQAPFQKGMVVVMDGMGETYRTMLRAMETDQTDYTSDLSFGGLDAFQCIPSDLSEKSKMGYFDWREAESVYVFQKGETSVNLRPVFKRFTEENSPPALYNHGFENMDSVGALYSRASSHIFGDWNACGKVMGLAPWIQHKWTDDDGNEVKAEEIQRPILSGVLYEDDGLRIDRGALEGLPCAARNDPDLFKPDGTRKKRYDFDDDPGSSDGAADTDRRLPLRVALDAIAISNRIQADTEAVVLDFVRHFKERTGESNLCLAGGVALNSVLNGRLARELGFERTFVPPYPGDDGISVGCCAFGLFGNSYLDDAARDRATASKGKPATWPGPLSPYLGPDPTELEMKEAIENAEPWIEVDTVRNLDRRLQLMAEEVQSGGVVAWYRSRSELGPRALGHRSILADPRKKGLVRFINEGVKRRESFRPFAPSVLEEEADKWFDLGDRPARDGIGNNPSPYMSMTATVREKMRSLIPAVTHVDGSSRLQTVSKVDEPIYHRFIGKFFELTGVPMVLNTSFNTLPGEPIVESPSDAVRSFLFALGSIEMLVMGDHVIKRREANLRKLLGETSKYGDMVTEPLCPKRTGPATFESTLHIDSGPVDEGSVCAVTRVRMPDRPTHSSPGNEWFEVLDELEGDVLSVCDGTVTLNDIMAQYTAKSSDEAMNEKDIEEAQSLLQNIVHRLVRLYDHTLISW